MASHTFPIMPLSIKLYEQQSFRTINSKGNVTDMVAQMSRHHCSVNQLEERLLFWIRGGWQWRWRMGFEGQHVLSEDGIDTRDGQKGKHLDLEEDKDVLPEVDLCWIVMSWQIELSMDCPMFPVPKTSSHWEEMERSSGEKAILSKSHS
jgi:hypothetical protein